MSYPGHGVPHCFLMISCIIWSWLDYAYFHNRYSLSNSHAASVVLHTLKQLLHNWQTRHEANLIINVLLFLTSSPSSSHEGSVGYSHLCGRGQHWETDPVVCSFWTGLQCPLPPTRQWQIQCQHQQAPASHWHRWVKVSEEVWYCSPLKNALIWIPQQNSEITITLKASKACRLKQGGDGPLYQSQYRLFVLPLLC